jgi:hypothetical protein
VLPAHDGPPVVTAHAVWRLHGQTLTLRRGPCHHEPYPTASPHRERASHLGPMRRQRAVRRPRHTCQGNHQGHAAGASKPKSQSSVPAKWLAGCLPQTGAELGMCLLRTVVPDPGAAGLPIGSNSRHCTNDGRLPGHALGHRSPEIRVQIDLESPRNLHPP